MLLGGVQESQTMDAVTWYKLVLPAKGWVSLSEVADGFASFPSGVKCFKYPIVSRPSSPFFVLQLRDQRAFFKRHLS